MIRRHRAQLETSGSEEEPVCRGGWTAGKMRAAGTDRGENRLNTLEQERD